MRLGSGYLQVRAVVGPNFILAFISGMVSNTGMDIKPGMWSCCKNLATKAVAFDNDDGGLVWYEACVSCASTVPQSRVVDINPILREKDGTEYQLVDGWLFRRIPGASGWVPAYGYADRQAQVRNFESKLLAPHGGCNWDGCVICNPPPYALGKGDLR